MDGLWTIDELSAGVAGALAADYPGQSNGRVREVPDRRTIRWYTTIGLLDRPVAMRGRTALYGRRHLLQLVAIKRLQADGRTLATVQEELVGATTATLESIARLPAGVPSPADVEPPPDRERFWAATPATAPAVPAAPATPATAPTAPAAPAAAPGAAPAATAAEPAAADTVIYGVRLGTGATLVLGAATHAPGPAELAAIQAAAGPLLEVLRRHGLDADTNREGRT